MSNLLRFDPFFTAFQPLLSDATASRRRRSEGFTPALELRETDAQFELAIDLPGVAPDAVDISVDGRELSVTGSRGRPELNEGDKVHVHERGFGRFVRKFTLPDEVDAEAISASLDHGVLTLTIPKTPASQPRKIPVGHAEPLRDTA